MSSPELHAIVNKDTGEFWYNERGHYCFRTKGAATNSFNSKLNRWPYRDKTPKLQDNTEWKPVLVKLEIIK
jgi:hypothetical protein